MKRKITNYALFVLLQLLITQNIYCQCLSGDCENGVGIYITADKTRVDGSWKNGQPNGKCKIFYKSGSTYDGNMVDGKKNGFGRYVFGNGNSYEGNFKNDKQHGPGHFVGTGGYTEEGKYVNDTLNGYATITFSNGDKYVGYTSDASPDGNGIYFFAAGDKFEGVYKHGKRNGNGTLYYAKGGTLKGVWLNGEYMSGSNKISKDKNSKIITPILGKSNIYEVNVLLNGVLKLDMIFDTGASEVYFTPDIVLTLIKTKTISEDDFSSR
jgi:hypothetical protein